MLPKEFKPIAKFELLRLGKNNDGGYLIEQESLSSANSLLSFGLGYDWSFEKDFFNYKRKNIDIHVYDYSIKKSNIKKFSLSSFKNIFKINYYFKKNFYLNLKNNLLLYSDYRKFFKKNVKHFNNAIGLGPNLINFNDTINKIDKFPIFLKMDIEGSEYRILDEIIKNQNKFCGLSVEFHSVDLHKERIIKFIKDLNMNLVHIHGQNVDNNNYLDKNGDPTNIEITFSVSKKNIGDKPEIPHSLDQPSDVRYKETKLNFEI